MHCDFEAAAGILRSMVERLIARENPGLSKRERELLTDFVMTDFIYYLGYKIGVFYSEEFNPSRVRNSVCRVVKDRAEWVRKLLREWYPWWRVKWLQRVKLVFSEEEFKRLTGQIQQSLVDTMALDSKVNNVRAFVIYMLIKSGEYAGVEPIADFIIKSELSSLSNELKIGGEQLEGYLNSPEFINRLIRRVNSLKEVSDPLLILRVDLAQVL